VSIPRIFICVSEFVSDWLPHDRRTAKKEQKKEMKETASKLAEKEGIQEKSQFPLRHCVDCGVEVPRQSQCR